MATNPQVRLSPEQFKAVLFGKGWGITDLAKRWGITAAWLHNIARNPNRASHYDDAVMGLPAKQNLGRSAKRRQAMANAYLAGAGANFRDAMSQNRGYLVVGEILSVAEDFGSLAEQGSRCIIFAARRKGATSEFGVVFENGNHEWIDRGIADQYLASTGLVASEAATFKFTDDDSLKQAFARGEFDFRP